MADAQAANATLAPGSFMVVNSFLDELVAGYESNPLRTRLAFRELLSEQPGEFLRSALNLFERGMCPGASESIAKLLLANDIALSALGDPALCSLPEALGLARAAARVEPGLDVRLMKRVWGTGHAPNTAVVLRVLEILTGISDGVRVMAQLMQLLRDPNPRVRSKVVLLIGRAKKELRWIEPYLKDPDHRIRANAVEACWSMNSAEATQVFKAASQDFHHRVAANACFGLVAAGCPDANLQVEQLASFNEPLFRAAAAWVMGKTGDPAFLPTVVEMAKSKESVVRRAAIRSVVALRKVEAERARTGASVSKPAVEPVQDQPESV